MAQAPSLQVYDSQFFQTQRRKCFNLCKGILWRGDIHYDDFICEELGRALTNHVYRCYDRRNPIPVLVRIYGNIAIEANFPEFHVKSLVVFNILAERNLGPKCLGYNNEGRIEELYTCENLQRVHMLCPLVTDPIVRKIAEVHTQEMPLSKEATFLNDVCDSRIARIQAYDWKNDRNISDEVRNKITSYDLTNELRRVIAAIEALNPKPNVVFSHNGLTEGDVLYLTESEEEDFQARLILIDFEYCAYNYQGYDLSMMFIECCIDYRNVSERPFFAFYRDDYPTEQRRKQILRSYLRAYFKATANPARVTDTEVNQLYNETERCALAVHLMWAIWGCTQYIIRERIPFGYLEYAVAHLEAYTEKARIIFQ